MSQVLRNVIDTANIGELGPRACCYGLTCANEDTHARTKPRGLLSCKGRWRAIPENTEIFHLQTAPTVRHSSVGFDRSSPVIILD